MIRRIESFDEALSAFCERDVFGIRSLGYHKTYGTEVQTVSFYAQFVENTLTGVLCDAFGHGSLTVSEQADTAEWCDFIRFLGLQSLLCARDVAERMRLSAQEHGSVMEYFGTKESVHADWISPFDPRFSYRQVFDLLERCDFALGEYASWFGDIALRVQRGAAQILTLEHNGRAVCTASVLFASTHQAYLGAVATDPNFRGQGLASKIVRYLAALYPTARILCKPHRVSFYTSIGFQQIGEFTICSFLK